jgi:hypothetical protein
VNELMNSAPSRINNLPLLHVSDAAALDELMGGPLRPQLKENYHYTLVPQEVWDAFVCWYGGGPTIARFVVQAGDPALGNAFNRVQVYPVWRNVLGCRAAIEWTDWVVCCDDRSRPRATLLTTPLTARARLWRPMAPSSKRTAWNTARQPRRRSPSAARARRRPLSQSPKCAVHAVKPLQR